MEKEYDEDIVDTVDEQGYEEGSYEKRYDDWDFKNL